MSMSKKTPIFITLSLAFLYGIYYFGIPAVLNTSKAEIFLEQKINKVSGYKIDITSPVFKMGLTPSLWLRAEEFSILNKDNSKALSLTHPNINIALLPLIFKDLEIKHFSSDKSFANIIVDKNSQIKLGDYPVQVKSESKFTLNKASVLLKDFNLNIKEYIQNKNIIVDGKLLNIKQYEKDKHIKASMNAIINVDKKLSEINFDTELKLPLTNIDEDKISLNANIKDLDLSIFSAYIKAISKNKYTTTRGILNFTSATQLKENKHKQIISSLILKDFGLINKDLAQASYCDGILTIKSDIETLKNGIRINSLSAKAPQVDISASGDVTKLNEKIPYLNLKTIINPSRTEKAIPILPGYENLLPEFNFYKLKKYILYANAIGHLDIIGKANAPEMFGDILLSDAYLIKRIPNTKEGARIKLSLNKQIMHLDGWVETDPNEEVTVDGEFKLFVNRRSELHIKSTKNINLKKAVDVVNPLHEILKFELGPVPMMTMSGYGNMDLRTAGTKAEPHAWGSMNFHKATAAFNDIHNVVLTDVEGKLLFNDRDVTFETTKASLNKLPVKITGTCSLAGGMDFVATANGQDLINYMKAIRTSPMLKELQEVVKPVEYAMGKADLYLNLTGSMKSGDEIIFNENLFAKGYLDLHAATMTVKDFPAVFKKISGRINFENNDGDFDIITTIGNSQVKANGTVKNEIITANASSDKFNAGDGLEIAVKLDKRIPNIKDLKYVNTAFTGFYKGKADGLIHFEGLTVNGKIYNNRESKQSIIISNNGTFNLKNLHLTVSPLKGTFKGSPFIAEHVEIHNMFSGNEIISGNFNLKNFDLENLNDPKLFHEIYPQYKDELKDFTRFSGKINIASRIKNNKVRLFTQLNDTTFVYRPKHIRVAIQNGNILLNDKNLHLNNINSFVGRMPLYLNGRIMNIQKNPSADVYVNAKPTQEFFDQFFNNKSVYPIKLKGDVNCTSRLQGPLDNLRLKAELKLDEESSLYYMGAIIGDQVNPVKINLDSTYTPQYIKINQFKYDKIITSQNNKQFPNTQLTANGTIGFIDKNNASFNNFKVKTHNPTDAKIFNIIFKKPLMKQGVFTSDLTINGTALMPKILGQLDVTSIDMPFFDATINDIHFDFKKDIVNISSKGNILTNNIKLEAIMRNSFAMPLTFENIKLHFDNLDLNKITQSLQDYDADLYKQQIATDNQLKNFNPENLVINKAEITADTIILKAIEATEFKAIASLNKSMVFDVNDYTFTLAQGNVTGNLQYNLLSKDWNIYSQINNANAQIISESLFDLKGQLYGTVNGDLRFQCDGKSQPSCLSTLSGEGSFEVAQGRMPKLGSLEYLLKAANLAKGGITGLSINGIIDLITPLKTGEFDSISGSYIVKDGIAQNIKVYSKGNALNLYLNGSYNVITSIADMKVYGTLSNNITNVFGRIKNASLNTLFKTIPLLNKNEISPELEAELNKIPNYNAGKNIFRIFAVDIDGDINGINYVKSFKWVK